MKCKKLKIIYITILLCSVFVINISAQQTIVNISIDSTSLLIGEQATIQLEVTTDNNKRITLPIFPDTIMAGVEVIEMLKADTLDIGNNRIQITQKYLITSFDSALYLLPPFPIIDGNDTIYSKSLGLKVSTLPVDTETQNFYDIKDVLDPPFVWKDYLWILYILLILIALALIIVFVVMKLHGKDSGITSFKKKDPPLPPHIKAINALDMVKENKIWQKGRIKEFHSEVTEILRIYIEERFGISALEMTSGEILSKIRSINDTDSVYDNLKQILQLADFVKFAKYHSLPDENELSLMNAYLFVNQTKEQEKLPENSTLEDDNNPKINSEREN